MADTFGDITAAHRLQYADNMQLAIQEKAEKFAGAYLPMTLKGKLAQAVEIVGKMEAELDAPDGSPSPDMAGSHLSIWAKPRKIRSGRLMARGDAIRACTDYTSPYVKAFAAAHVQKKNAIIAGALFGPRLVKAAESDVPVSTAWAGSSVAVNYAYGGGGSNSGLSIPKIIKGLEYMGLTEMDIDLEDMHLGMTMKQNTDLYNDIKVINRDYQERAILSEKTKTVREVLGIQIHIYNSMPVNGSGYRRVALWAKDGLYVGDAGEKQRVVAPDITRENQMRIYNEDWIGATRSEDERVVEILCLES